MRICIVEQALWKIWLRLSESEVKLIQLSDSLIDKYIDFGV